MSKPRLLSGHEYQHITNEELKKLGQDLVMYKHGMAKILPEGWFFPAVATRYLDRIQKMQFNENDVFVMTFPKCGTTWMQEILWMMIKNPSLDSDGEGMKEPLWVRSMDISLDMMFDNLELAQKGMDSLVDKFNRLCPGQKEEDGICLQIIETQKSPRVIKTHFPLELMPKDILKKAKVVYVCRNPKDMLVSYHHYARVAIGASYKGSLDKFANEVINDNMLYCPYWAHVKQAWELREHTNLHFTTYEDMKDDIMKELHRLNTFLGTGLKEEQLMKIAEFTSFKSMKTRGEPIDKAFYNEKVFKQSGGMFRKGEKGDWKNHFSPELNEKVDKWIQDNTAGTDLDFKF